MTRNYQHYSARSQSSNTTAASESIRQPKWTACDSAPVLDNPRNIPLDMDYDIVLRGLAKRLTRCASASSQDSTLVRNPFNWTSRATPLELEAWLQRIRKYSLATPQAFVMAVSYVERAGPLGLSLNLKNVHYITLLCVATATKYLDDHYVSNKRYSQIGDIDIKLYNQLEGVLLNLLDFDLSCSPEMFEKHMHEVNAEASATYVAPSLARVASSEDTGTRGRSNSCGQDIVAESRGRSDSYTYLVSA